MNEPQLPEQPPFETMDEAFPPPRPPVPPTRRTADRRGRRFAAGIALGALVGASVAGGIVAVAGHTDHTTTVTASAPATAGTAAAVAGTPVATSQNAIAALVQKAEPSVVSIHDDISQTDKFGQTQSGQAAGSGFVLSADGYIVTNNHVIDGATNITVDFHDGTTAKATVVAHDPNSDLAVLKVDRSGLTPLPMGSSSALQVGDQLVAIGNALDLSGRTDGDHRHRVGQGSLAERGERRRAHRHDPDRHRDQPRQLRRAAAQHGRAGRRHQHGRRRPGPEHRLRDLDRPRQVLDRPAREGAGPRPRRAGRRRPAHR